MKSLSQQIQELTRKLDNIQMEADFDQEIFPLIESLLAEDSTLLKIIGNNPQGRNLARYMHRYHKASDTANWEEVPLSQHFKWEDNFKEYADNMLLMQGTNGWAMFKASPEYQKLEKELGTTKGAASDNLQPYEFYVAVGDKVLSDEEIDAEIEKIEQDRYKTGVSKLKSTDNYVRRGTRRGGKGANQRDPRNPDNMFDTVREVIGPKITNMWVARGREDLSAATTAYEPKRQEILKKLGLTDKPSNTWTWKEREAYDKEAEKLKSSVNLAGGKAGKRFMDQPGASRQAYKMAVRRPAVKASISDAEPVYTRLWKLAPNLMRQVFVRLERKDAPESAISKAEEAMRSYNPEEPTGLWISAVETAFGKLDYNTQQAASKLQVAALKEIIPMIRDMLEYYFKR